MLTMGTMEFVDWLRKTMREKNISQAELARRSGLSPAQISKIHNGLSKPSEDGYVAIAQGLGVSRETVLRAAGILADEPEYVPLLDEWNDIFYELSPEDQLEMLEIARLKAKKFKRPPIEKPIVRQKSSRGIRPARTALIKN